MSKDENSPRGRMDDCVEAILKNLDEMGEQNRYTKSFGYAFAPYKPELKFLEYMAYYTLAIGIALEKNGWEFRDLRVSDREKQFAVFVTNKYYVPFEDEFDTSWVNPAEGHDD